MTDNSRYGQLDRELAELLGPSTALHLAAQLDGMTRAELVELQNILDELRTFLNPETA